MRKSKVSFTDLGLLGVFWCVPYCLATPFKKVLPQK